jgi:hypothetical protein
MKPEPNRQAPAMWDVLLYRIIALNDNARDMGTVALDRHLC